MELHFDLYGFLTGHIDSIANTIERCLNIHLIARDSSYKGEYYSAIGEGEENFDLEENYNKIEEDWTEPDFKQYPIILYISGTRRAYELEKLIRNELGENVILLRRETSFSDKMSKNNGQT